MRLAFIAAEAENVVKRRRPARQSRQYRQIRRSHSQSHTRISSRSIGDPQWTSSDDGAEESREDVRTWRTKKRKRSHFYANILEPCPCGRDADGAVYDREDAYHPRRHTWPTIRRSNASIGRRIFERNSTSYAQDPDFDQNNITNRRTIFYGPFLALWHLASLSLFLLATLAFAGVMAETDDGSSPSSKGSNLKVIVVDSMKKSLSGSCNRYEYFLSPSKFPTPSSTTPASKSPDDLDLVKRSTSPFYASNPALENVFSIWLRASRSSRTSSLEDGGDSSSSSSSSSMFALPLNAPQRTRYQYYFNSFGAAGLASDDHPIVASAGTVTAKLNDGGGSGDDDEADFGGDFASDDSLIAYQAEKMIGPSSNSRIQQCELFDEPRVDEICVLDARHRVEKLRHVFVRTDMATNRSSLILESGNNNAFVNYNCNSSASTTRANASSNLQPMTLYTFFQLDISYDGALAKSNPVRHLAPEFRPCILSAPENSRSDFSTATNFSRPNSCRTCYKNVLQRLKAVDARQENFSVSVLSMLDCEPDNDLEQFSPTSNCSECKVWYRRWLLVILTAVWKQKPCLQWCTLAELACPHLPPVRKNDYAGLPSFRCIDPEVGNSWNSSSTYGKACDCMHPCDPSAPTVYWGWNVTGEKPEFCKDYRKRDCPANKIPIKTKMGDRRVTTTTTVSTTTTTTTSSISLGTAKTSTGNSTSAGNTGLSSANFSNSGTVIVWTFTVYGFLRWRYGET